MSPIFQMHNVHDDFYIKNLFEYFLQKKKIEYMSNIGVA